MYFTRFILSALLAVSTAVRATPLQAGAAHEEVRNLVRAAEAATEIDRRAAATNTSLDCAQASILAMGIALNIMDQMQEQASLAQVNTALAAKPVDAVAFTAAKEQLLVFINNGIAIRESNQFITPRGNPATAGLAIVSSLTACISIRHSSIHLFVDVRSVLALLTPRHPGRERPDHRARPSHQPDRQPGHRLGHHRDAGQRLRRRYRAEHEEHGCGTSLSLSPLSLLSPLSPLSLCASADLPSRTQATQTCGAGCSTPAPTAPAPTAP
jgi:hypothetical protein